MRIGVAKARSRPLADKVVMVTGATRGFGREIAMQCALAGATVLVCCRDRTAGQRVAREIRKHGGKVRALSLNLSDSKSVESVRARALRASSRLDVLIHNAAVFHCLEDRKLEDTPSTVHVEAMTVNALAPARLTARLLPLLRQSDQPQIVFVSSDDSAISNAGDSHVAYAMSKAAQNILMVGFAVQLSGEGFRVFGYDPGWMQTDMGGSAAPGDPVLEATALTDLLVDASAAVMGRVFRQKALASWWTS